MGAKASNSGHGGRWYSRPMDWEALETEAQQRDRGRLRRRPSWSRARVGYLGRKCRLAQALRSRPRPRDRHAAERRPRPAREPRSPSAQRSSSAPSSTARSPRSRRRHAAGRRAAARPSAPDHADAPRDRGRVPRPRLRGARRPRGRDDVDYNFDKLAFDPWHPARSPRATFFFDENRAAAHRDVAVADPGARGARAADLHGLARPLLPARLDRRDALPDLPPVRRARRRPRPDARRPQGDAPPRDARDLRARPARPVPHALLPVHRALDGARRLLRDLRRRRLPHVPLLGLARDGRLRDGRPARVRERRRRPGGVVRASRSAAGSSASRSCGTTSPTSARSGRATSAS